ncbi:HK97 family phage prohead protease [Paenibacillus assamensis]|uniref:HK97 family phage prohead protease n=1 Tax=Paenibacillus assamensis TaxID=311244 RepID=UPI00056D6E03|nr:HK97 family phage prohead protease [Paenibacillus assamensis]
MTRTLLQPIEIRTAADGTLTRTITGYVVKWGKRSQLLYGEFYEVVQKGAFARSLKEDTVKALWNHRTDFVLGSTKSGTLRLEEDNIGLRFEIDLPDSTWGNDAFESIKRGDTDGVSFGFGVREGGATNEYLSDEDVYERTLLNVRLYEVSPTPFPAYEDSEANAEQRSTDMIGMETRTQRKELKECERLKDELELLELELGLL